MAATTGLLRCDDVACSGRWCGGCFRREDDPWAPEQPVSGACTRAAALYQALTLLAQLVAVVWSAVVVSGGAVSPILAGSIMLFTVSAAALRLALPGTVVHIEVLRGVSGPLPARASAVCTLA